MSEIDISQLLNQMRAVAAQSQGLPATPEIGQSNRPDFAAMLQNTVSKVNETQTQAGQLATALEKGDPTVDVAQVMVAMQKANVSFQAMTQVRNKLVSAYQEIMGMQV
jgi:flagellar hook-basal body complex protein FliE